MANTYSQLFYHIVFSTKERRKFIHQEIEERVWNYIGGIARKHDLTPLRVGGIEDHVHGLMMTKPIVAPCKIPMWLKGGSFKVDPRRIPKSASVHLAGRLWNILG